jgi:hypothetical protein
MFVLCAVERKVTCGCKGTQWIERTERKKNSSLARFNALVQTGTGTHSASYTMCVCSISWG